MVQKKLTGKYKVFCFLISVIFLYSIFVRLQHLQAPLLNAHYFRQTQTATVARNFYRKGIDLLQPRLDVFGIGKNDVLVLEFPLFQAIVTIFYRIFGLHDYVGRLVAIIFSVVAGIFLCKILVNLTKEYIWTVSSVVFFLFAPVNIFFHQAYMVESSVIALHLVAVVLWMSYLKSQRFFLFLISVTVTSLAFVTKSIYAPVLLGTIISMGLLFRRLNHKEVRLFFTGIILSVFFLLLWQTYADSTNISNGHVYFASGNSGQLLWNVGTWQERFSLVVWRSRIHDVLAALSKPFVFFMLIGTFVSIARIKQSLCQLCLALLAISVGYYLIFFRIQSHIYYLSPILPYLSIIAGFGVYQSTLFLLKLTKISWIAKVTITVMLLFFTIKAVRNTQPYFVIDYGMQRTLEKISSNLTTKGPDLLILSDPDWNSVYSYFLDRKLLYSGAQELYPEKLEYYRNGGYRYIIVDGLPGVLSQNGQVKELLQSLHNVYQDDRLAIYNL